MIYLITGATGLVGSEIANLCINNGDAVHFLTTSKKKIKEQTNLKGFFWNPNNGEIDTNAFNGVSKIIHLAGASVAKRWTTSYKKTILESRILTANLLHKTLSEIDHQITHFVSASAIGIYQSCFTELYTEDSTKESIEFLGKTVKAWEQAADSFASLQIKVSKVRIGLVLSDKDGALPKIVTPIKNYVGAAFASGKQWQSWIHVEDLAKLFIYVCENNLNGIYNAVAPNPVTQNKLIKVCAEQLEKPLTLPNIPKFAAKLMLGEMHHLVVDSQRVSANKILSKGFNFQFPTIESAIANLYG